MLTVTNPTGSVVAFCADTLEAAVTMAKEAMASFAGSFIGLVVGIRVGVFMIGWRRSRKIAKYFSCLKSFDTVQGMFVHTNESSDSGIKRSTFFLFVKWSRG